MVDTVKSLMADSVRSVPPLQQREIGVMAPWREQVWKLRERWVEMATVFHSERTE